MSSLKCKVKVRNIQYQCLCTAHQSSALNLEGRTGNRTYPSIQGPGSDTYQNAPETASGLQGIWSSLVYADVTTDGSQAACGYLILCCANRGGFLKFSSPTHKCSSVFNFSYFSRLPSDIIAHIPTRSASHLLRIYVEWNQLQKMITVTVSYFS